MLFTNNGLASVTSQKLNVPLAWGNVTQPTFSPDGTKFGYTTYVPYQPDSGLFAFLTLIDVQDSLAIKELLSLILLLFGGLHFLIILI